MEIQLKSKLLFYVIVTVHKQYINIYDSFFHNLNNNKENKNTSSQLKFVYGKVISKLTISNKFCCKFNALQWMWLQDFCTKYRKFLSSGHSRDRNCALNFQGFIIISLNFLTKKVGIGQTSIKTVFPQPPSLYIFVSPDIYFVVVLCRQIG